MRHRFALASALVMVVALSVPAFAATTAASRLALFGRARPRSFTRKSRKRVGI